MKDVSVALKAHLALPTQTMCTLWRVDLTNGLSNGFTDHDADVLVSGWAAPHNILNGLYYASSGFSAKAYATSDALNVDTTEIDSVLSSITEDDLRLGLYDFAKVYVFEVNWADVSMGPLYKRVGWLGEVSVGRSMFRAEFRGLMQLYTRTLVELTSPMCRAKLGDARCGKDLTAFTFSGSVDSVNADNQTFADSGLTQDGPSTGVAVTGVTNANPGVVTMADDSLHLVANQPVTLSGIGGMTAINTVTLARNPSGATFELGIDTTDTAVYPAYTSGGTVTPLGVGGGGYFGGGTLTWLTGLNSNLSMEVKAFVTGQVTLSLPMPHAIAPGDTFSIVAGCEHSLTACRDTFDNIVNFRGEPYLPGADKIIQVGRH